MLRFDRRLSQSSDGVFNDGRTHFPQKQKHVRNRFDRVGGLRQAAACCRRRKYQGNVWYTPQQLSMVVAEEPLQKVLRQVRSQSQYTALPVTLYCDSRGDYVGAGDRVRLFGVSSASCHWGECPRRPPASQRREH